MRHNLVVVAAGLMALGCSGSTDVGDTSVPASLTLSTTSVSTYPGASVALPKATVYNSAHQVIVAAVRWSSGDTAIARITNDTVVTGNAQGTTVLTAMTTTGSASATASANVVQEPVAGIIVVGNSTSIYANDSLLLRAYAVGPTNDSLAGHTFTWSALTPSVATISSEGMVHIHGVGAAEMVASSDGVADTATIFADARRVARIEVTPASLELVVGGEQKALVFHLFDASDEELDDRPIGATIVNTAIVTSGDLPSLWTYAGNAPGTTEILVRSDTAVTHVPVTVTAGP